MPETSTEAELAELAIAVYIEELATDKRVLYVGDPQSGGPERLSRVARSVDLVSPRARARGTRRGARVQSRRWPRDDERGRWDVVVVPDIAAAGLSQEGQLERVETWLAPGGVLVAGSDGSDRGLSYEGLFDLLQDAFDTVRMVGQAPFRGFSIVDFEPKAELEVTFDGSLLEGAGEQAARFLALCADDEVVLDPYAVVQIPTSTATAPAPEDSAQAARVSELTERLREQQDALDAANVHAESLERELEQVRARADAARDAQRGAADQAEAVRNEHEAALREARSQIASLEKKAATQDGQPRSEPTAEHAEEYARLETQLRESGRQLTQLRVELERRGTLVRDLVEELAEARELEALYADAQPEDEAFDDAPHAAPEEPIVEAYQAPPAPEPAIGEGETVVLSAAQLDRTMERQVTEAVERAVAAEADKVALEFKLDELRSELAVAGQARESGLEEMARLEAALRGTVRGLNARLAEVTELYQQAQARVALLEDDRQRATEHAETLERTLAESREQLELHIARTSTIREVRGTAETVPPAPESPQTADASSESESEEARLTHERTLAAREGKLLGALMRCRDEATEIALQRRQAELEAQIAKEALAEAHERVEGLRRGYTVRIAELAAELDQSGGEAERALVQAGELKARLDAMERTEARLRGELVGTQLRLTDREAAVEALSARAAEQVSEALVEGAVVGAADEAEPARIEELESQVTRMRSESEALRVRLEETTFAQAEVAELRAKLEERAGFEAEAEALRAQIEQTSQAVREAESLRAEVAALRAEGDADKGSDRAADTEIADADTPAAPAVQSRTVDESASRWGARDAMIARLQRELSDAVERHRALERRFDDANEALEVQRERVESARVEGEVEQEEAHRELEALTARVEQAELERGQALDSLEALRALLRDLADRLPELTEPPLASDGAISSEVRGLRERLSRLDAQAADREVLLRSLTAQLQERDDRIRALESFEPEDDADPAALKVRLLELEERSARLAEELENERRARRRLEDER